MQPMKKTILRLILFVAFVLTFGGTSNNTMACDATSAGGLTQQSMLGATLVHHEIACAMRSASCCSNAAAISNPCCCALQGAAQSPLQAFRFASSWIQLSHASSDGGGNAWFARRLATAQPHQASINYAPGQKIYLLNRALLI